MYLSQLDIDLRYQPTSRYEYHQLVTAGFPSDAKETRTLFRIDYQEGGFPIVLVQSHIRPDWTRLRAVRNWRLKEVDIAGALRPEGVYLYRIDANPCVTRLAKRHGLYEEKDQQAWFKERVAGWGVSLLSDPAISVPPLPIGGRRKGKPITLAFARYEGHLRVQDVALLGTVIENGVGSAKAFGLGLLSLAPA